MFKSIKIGIMALVISRLEKLNDDIDVNACDNYSKIALANKLTETFDSGAMSLPMGPRADGCVLMGA